MQKETLFSMWRKIENKTKCKKGVSNYIKITNMDKYPIRRFVHVKILNKKHQTATRLWFWFEYNKYLYMEEIGYTNGNDCQKVR